MKISIFGVYDILDADAIFGANIALCQILYKIKYDITFVNNCVVQKLNLSLTIIIGI